MSVRRIGPKVVEESYPDEATAHAQRRQAIVRGRLVSLVAFDPERGAYAFDVYE